MSVQAAKLLSVNPLVAVYDDFFDRNLADHILSTAGSAFERSRVVDNKGGSKEEDTRTNEQVKVDQWADPRITELVTRISALVRLPPENSEPCQLLRYRGDQKFDPHSDAFYRTAGGIGFLAQGGQRLFTVLCYLNDVASGGETEFPDLKIKIKPKCGRVLIFGNTLLGTSEPHPHSLHAGWSVDEGDKFTLAMWWRQLAYHIQREYPAEKGDTRVID